MNEKEDSKLALEMVLEEGSDTETARQAELLLEQLGGKSTSNGNTWWVTAGVSSFFDDNVTVEEQDQVSQEQDMALNYVFGLGKKFSFHKDIDFDLGYDFAQILWDKLPQFDYQSHDINTSSSYEFGDWNANLGYSFNYSLLDRQDFLAVHRVTPRLDFAPKPHLYTSASYSFSRKNFISSNTRDGVNHSTSLSQFLFFMESKAYVLLSYGLELEDVEDAELDYTGHSILGQLSLPIPFNISTELSYKYNYEDYKNNTSSIGEPRLDRKQTVQLELSRYFLDSYKVSIEYSRLMSDSNLESVDFVQNIFLLGLKYEMQ
jgi:hypothetical protein